MKLRFTYNFYFKFKLDYFEINNIKIYLHLLLFHQKVHILNLLIHFGLPFLLG